MAVSMSVAIPIAVAVAVAVAVPIPIARPRRSERGGQELEETPGHGATVRGTFGLSRVPGILGGLDRAAAMVVRHHDDAAGEAAIAGFVRCRNQDQVDPAVLVLATALRAQ